MIWAGSTVAGFGLRGKVVVAWYCKDAAVEDVAAAKKNIGKYCMVDGRNECFATMQLDAQNEHRAAHAVDALEEDAAKSKALQEALDADTFAGTVDPDDAECATIVYEEKDEAKVAALATTTALTDTQYGYKKFYDFAAGAPKTAEAGEDQDAIALASAGFTAMVWKASTKAGYAVSGRWAAARYCTEKANDGDAAAYQANVLKRCIDDGVDTCFNDAQRDAHNTYRGDHLGTEDLEANTGAAKAIQELIDGLTDDEKAADPFAFTDKERPSDYEKCGQTLWTATDETSAETDKASETIYGYNGEYDDETGEPANPADEAKVAQA